MESIETTVIIRTHNNTKAVKHVKKLEKRGFIEEIVQEDFDQKISFGISDYGIC